MTERQKILIADDNEHNREYVRQVLSDGWEVVLAADGAEALDVVAQERPDFVLLDLSMPRVDGWEVARVLKGDPRTADLPLVACTAHAMRGDKERAFEAGFDGYLAKPFRPSDLLECIESYLGEGVGSGDDDEWALDGDLDLDD